MPGRAPRRYKMDENGTMCSAFYGKLPEEFNERDMLAFAADTDLLLFQKVSEETLAAIRAAGYDYQGGAVISRPGKEDFMAYVPVPNDLNRIKTKLAFNLTKRHAHTDAP